MEAETKTFLQHVQMLLDKSGMEYRVGESRLSKLPGGSDRRFYRLSGRKRFVIMVAPTGREVKDYIQIQQHLLRQGVAVPEIYAASIRRHLVLMEDIGSRSLRRIVREATGQKPVEEVYERVVHALIHLQLSGNIGIEKCKPVFERVFNDEVLRWESDYFRTWFLEGWCGCSRGETGKLERDFQRLARSLANEPRYFMHRDFQSTNIFLRAGEVRIIDFQSAHRGMPSYDLAALLRDAYVTLPAKTRKRLFRLYFSLLQQRTDAYRHEEDFRKAYVLSAIQRNMQALGAFSFLSMVKKKRWFLKAIPRAIVYLQEGLDEAGTFRTIQRMVNTARVKACVQSMSS